MILVILAPNNISLWSFIDGICYNALAWNLCNACHFHGNQSLKQCRRWPWWWCWRVDLAGGQAATAGMQGLASFRRRSPDPGATLSSVRQVRANLPRKKYKISCFRNFFNPFFFSKYRSLLRFLIQFRILHYFPLSSVLRPSVRSSRVWHLNFPR